MVPSDGSFMVPSSWFLSTASFPWTGPGTKRGLVSDCGWCEHTLLRTRLPFHSPRQGPQALSTLCGLIPVPLSLWISRPGCAAADRLSLPRHPRVPGLSVSHICWSLLSPFYASSPGVITQVPPSAPPGTWESAYPPFSVSPTYAVQFSRSVMSDSLRPHGLQHARLPCPSATPRTCSDSCPMTW